LTVERKSDLRPILWLEVAFRIARHLDAELDVVFGYRD
jgi:hypothetical protein